MALEPGTRLGPYEISALVGVGGMGEVYRATDTKLGREVAIKVLPASLAQDPDRLTRFDREARTLATLNHPNIAAIHGLEDADGTKALVMELVEGPTLADRIALGAIPWAEALPIAQQIADALEAAHERGIVHRDLKPANIKLRPDGTVKVLDFGLAKAVSPAEAGHHVSHDLSQSPTITTPAHLRQGYGGQAMTQMGVILGTAAYMSPEQARGKPVDKRADIWAFGCVVFEMLTGRRAFDAEDVSLTLSKVLQREPDFAALPPDVPPGVGQTLRLCLRKDPRERIADIRDARLALEGVFSAAVPALESTSQRSALPPHGRALLLFIAGAVLAGVSAWYLKPSGPGLVTKVAIDLVAAPTLIDAITVSPDGRRIVYPAENRLWVRALDQAESVAIPGTEGGSAPFFSPDGARLAFFTPTQLKTVDLRGGLPLVIAPVDGGIQGAWDERGRIVFGVVGPAGLSMVAETGGAIQPFVPLEKQHDIDFPDALPGGEWILFSKQRSANWDDGQIVAKSLTTGEQRVVLDGGFYARYVSTGHLVYARSRTLYAARFDADRLQVVGDPVPVVEDVQMASFLAGQAQFAISRNGTLVYRRGTDNAGELRLIGPDGDTRRLDLPPQTYANPRLSPDGSRFAVETIDDSGRSRILVYSLTANTQGRELTANGTNPVWTDSRRIAFHGVHDGVRGLYVQQADGASAPELLLESSEEAPWVPMSASPDGQVVLLMRGGVPGGLFSLSVARGGEPEIIPRTAMSLAAGATFSPDGKWIAYQRSVSGNPTNIAIHLQRYPPTGVEHSISPDMRIWPVWTRTNDIVYMAGLIGESISLAAVRVNPATLSWERERMLPVNVTGHRLQRGFDVGRSGEFLVVTPSQLGRAQLNVIINWSEELKQRVP